MVQDSYHCIIKTRKDTNRCEQLQTYYSSMLHVRATGKNDTKQSHADNRQKAHPQTIWFPTKKELYKAGIASNTAYRGQIRNETNHRSCFCRSECSLQYNKFQEIETKSLLTYFRHKIYQNY